MGWCRGVEASRERCDLSPAWPLLASEDLLFPPLESTGTTLVHLQVFLSEEWVGCRPQQYIDIYAREVEEMTPHTPHKHQGSLSHLLWGLSQPQCV